MGSTSTSPAVTAAILLCRRWFSASACRPLRAAVAVRLRSSDDGGVRSVATGAFARLFFLAAPGSTPEIAQTWAEFVEEHVRDLARYVQGPADGPAGKRSPSGDLAARTAIGAANAAAMAWLSGDLFGKRTSRTAVADAVGRVMLRLLPDGPGGSAQPPVVRSVGQ